MAVGRPRDWVDAAVAAHGVDALVDWCVRVLTGTGDQDQLALETAGGAAWVDRLGGDPGTYYRQRLTGGDPLPAYWLRTWAARALLYAWTDAAVPGVAAGLADPDWRPREMCAKVCTHRELDLDGLSSLLDDPNARVRRAAQRAVLTVDR